MNPVFGGGGMQVGGRTPVMVEVMLVAKPPPGFTWLSSILKFPPELVFVVTETVRVTIAGTEPVHVAGNPKLPAPADTLIGPGEPLMVDSTVTPLRMPSAGEVTIPVTF